MRHFIVAQLENIDYQFKKVANSDFDITNQNMTTAVASVTTREIQEMDSPFNDMFMRDDIPVEYKVDAKSFIERPFFVDQLDFPDTAARYNLLSTTVKFMPGDIARSNPSVLNMFKMAAYGKPDLVINVSMAGTITHAGCVLVGVMPPMPAYPTLNSATNKSLINTILSGPHAFLHANEATSVAIPVPWFCNTDLATTDMDQTAGYDTTLDITVTNGNYATLIFLVLNPLIPSNGSSKTLKIIVEACFKNFDLSVPTPRYVAWVAQSGRQHSMYNPTYEDYDKYADELGFDEWRRAPEPVKRKIFAKTARLVPIFGGVISVLAVIMRVGFICFLGEDIPIDHVIGPFEAQSGLVSSMKNMATGLLDSATGGLKLITSDALDAGRGLIRKYTGLHNPNVPEIQERVINTSLNFVNNADCPQFFEKLDPYTRYNRIVKEPIFGSAIDEMAASHITTKRQMIGSFSVKTTDGVGVMKWARPISPFQGGASVDTNLGAIECYNNLELMHSMSRGWRGGLKLTIQSVMNNKQQCKLKVVKMYNPSVRATSSYPTYQSIVNAPTHLLEFTEGGQEHVVDLPYLCRNDITPCAANTDTEALFHGLYYIYVAQPLVVSDTSPLAIEFNIYLEGARDLTFYGYTTAATYHSSYFVIPTPLASAKNPRLGYNTDSTDFLSVAKFKPSVLFLRNGNKANEAALLLFEIESKDPSSGLTEEMRKDYSAYKEKRKEQIIAQGKLWESVKAAIGDDDNLSSILDSWSYASTGQCVEARIDRLRAHQITRLKEILAPLEREVFSSQSGAMKVMNEPQHQDSVSRCDDKEVQLSHMSRLMPTLDIRHFLRRMYKSEVYTADLDPMNTVNTSVPLSSFLGESPGNWNYTPIETFSRMYYGKSVGFKFRCVVSLIKTDEETITEVDSLNLRLYYVPQNLNALTSQKIVASALPNLNSVGSPVGIGFGTPLPFQIVSKDSTTKRMVYEFSVPDTSFYKFMGGPNKFYNFDTNINVSELSQNDFGTVIFQFTNTSGQKTARYSFELFIGLTDESRFGYHTMAPPFLVFKTGATYLGSDTASNDTVPYFLNPKIYRGGFL